MKVEFDISFPQIACSLLTLDVVDEAGKVVNDDDIHHSIYKYRIDPNGNDNGDGAHRREMRKVNLGEALRSEDDLKRGFAEEHEKLVLSDAKLRDKQERGASAPACGDCYGAGDFGECCNSCDDVR